MANETSVDNGRNDKLSQLPEDNSLISVTLPRLSPVDNRTHSSHTATTLCVNENALRLQISPTFEMLERKGIGHPDSLADLIAETFSCFYSRECINRFGHVLNHWVDKVVLAGGVADLDFGKCEIKKPITAYLLGRVTTDAYGESIDHETLFKGAVRHVFESVFPGTDILQNTQYEFNININLAKDHPKDFFQPNHKEQFQNYVDLGVANDSVAVCAFAPFSEGEFLTIALENFINGATFKNEFPQTGSDVKVLTVVQNGTFDVTVCLPFLATRTPDFSTYKQTLEKAQEYIHAYMDNLLDGKPFSLHINTKDREEFAYLTAFGTSLDKGDYGAVGRGNKPSGVISIARQSHIEAVNGKNPVHHSGKIYSYLAQSIANKIYDSLRYENVVNIACRNGCPLTEPAYISVELKNGVGATEQISQIIQEELSNISHITHILIHQDPVASFKSWQVSLPGAI